MGLSDGFYSVWRCNKTYCKTTQSLRKENIYKNRCTIFRCYSIVGRFDIYDCNWWITKFRQICYYSSRREQQFSQKQIRILLFFTVSLRNCLISCSRSIIRRSREFRRLFTSLVLLAAARGANTVIAPELDSCFLITRITI